MDSTENEQHSHILFADNDEDTLRIFGHYLCNADFEVIYAHDGNECRELARRLNPDLILLDYHLPVLNGLEAATRLKTEQETKHIPIILFTNEDLSREAEEKFKELGVDDYLHKSIELSVLVTHVKNVLAKTANQRPRIIWARDAIIPSPLVHM